MTPRETTTLHVMRTVVMIAIAVFFLSLPIVIPEPNRIGWLGMAIVMSSGVLILYVEFWLWRRWCAGTDRGVASRSGSETRAVEAPSCRTAELREARVASNNSL